MTTSAADLHDRDTGLHDRGAGADRADLLSDVLARLRLSGAIFMQGEYSAPWAFDSPEAGELARLLAPGAERLIIFHAILRGRTLVATEDGVVQAEAGDLVVLPHGDRHLMGNPDVGDPAPFVSILPPRPWSGIPQCRWGSGGEVTEVACGYFRCHEFLFHSFLRRLPKAFRVRPQGVAADMLQAAIRYAVDEPSAARQGQVALMSRLPELLLVECLRLHSETAEAPTGWFAAARDPVISRALRLLHAHPERNWGADALARLANTSRSVLNERFRTLIGKSPMHYLFEWRMQLAADLLRTTELKLAVIAERSGYGSESAFSRAFQRHVGIPPARWRAEMTP